METYRSQRQPAGLDIGSSPVLRRRRVLGLLPSMTVAGLWSSMAHAHSGYPQHPVKLVVPAPPGSSPDVMARQWGERFSKLSGVPVLVENKTGATTIIAAQAVANAPADGYTLLWTFNNTFSINPFVFRKLPYTIEDFVPVTQVLAVPFVLLVAPQARWRTLGNLLDDARARPNALNYGSAGMGSGFHVAMARLLNATGTSMTHVPYRDAFIPDLIAGRIDVTFDASTTAIAQVRGGTLRALGVSDPKRLEQLPDVPAIAETVPGYSANSWQGLFAPKGTPNDVVQTLAALSSQIVAAPGFRTQVREYGLLPVGSTPSAFQKFVTEDARDWGRVIRDNRITID